MLLSTGIAREAVFTGRDDVLGRVGRHQSDRWKLDDEIEMMRRGGWQAPPPHVHAPAPAAGDLAARLRDLAARRSEGTLTDAQFSAEKAKLLAG